MEQIQKDRMRKLIGFLRELPKEQFDFRHVVSEFEGDCCTVGCAIGWTPKVFPELVKWDHLDLAMDVRLIGSTDESDYAEVASALFGLPAVMSSDLFCPMLQDGIHARLPVVERGHLPQRLPTCWRSFLSW